MQKTTSNNRRKQPVNKSFDSSSLADNKLYLANYSKAAHQIYNQAQSPNQYGRKSV